MRSTCPILFTKNNRSGYTCIGKTIFRWLTDNKT